MKLSKVIFNIIIFILLFEIMHTTSIATNENQVWDGTITKPSQLIEIDQIYYYKISSPQELAYIAQMSGEWLKHNYILANDIVLNSKELSYDENGNLTVDAKDLNEWKSIEGFEGIFDGNGFSISGVYVNSEESAGLFGDCNGDIYNLTVKNSYIKGTSYVGGICSSFCGTGREMKNCFYNGAIVGQTYVGGLIGYNNCTNISDSGNYGNIWATGDYIAGIVGGFYAYGIDNCFNEGNVCSTGNYVAGIAGSSDIYGISNCVNKGNISGKNYVSGICSQIEMAALYKCGNIGEINGEKYVGGICGYGINGAGVTSYTSSIIESYSTGEINGELYVGGIVGYTEYCNVDKCYSVGNVTGIEKVGALIGHTESIWGKGTVSNCYYFKDENINSNLSGFGNANDLEGVVRNKKSGYFPILLDSEADTSFDKLGYQNGEIDEPLDEEITDILPPESEEIWDGTTLQPTVIIYKNQIAYYQIFTGKELAYISQVGGEWLKYNYILANDIVLNSEELSYDENGNLTVDAKDLNEWKSIEGFEGIFDGNGFSISGVYVNSEELAGLFGDCNGDIYNLTVKNSYIKGTSYVGGICGSFCGTGREMKNCFYNGVVVGQTYVGGLIGYNNCTNISDSGNYGNIWATGDYIAGIVGGFYAYGIDNCFNEGNVCSTGNYIAGIAGSSDIYGISNCVNKGNISGKNYVSGICSQIEMAALYKCGNIGEINGEKYVGGICGYGINGAGVTSYTSSIIESYATGEINGELYVGGIVGYTEYCNVDKCYSVGNVTGIEKVGALIGYTESIWGKGTVSDCYYLKDENTNSELFSFGNLDNDADNVIKKDKKFFPVCIDKNADASYENLGYRYTIIYINFDETELKKEIIKEGESANPPELQKRNGYYFKGWYTEKEGGEPVVDFTSIKNDLIIYAQWKIKGDVNGDGKIRIYDAFQILKDTLVPGTTLSEIDIQIRDFNGDGQVRIYDAFQFLKQAILG